jgi:tetratricopeptide (TPR) repeat protein
MKPIALIFWLASTVAFCQDSLVTVSQLTFNSQIEKSAFNTLRNANPSYFDLLVANGGVLTEQSIVKSKEAFYQHLSTLRPKVEAKKNDKKIKTIFEDLHKAFLKKYELQNAFEHIFVNGSYNCVSASALYALAFDYFSIPYNIIEKPTHVYLIGYPSSEPVLVETTAPSAGYQTLSDQLKHNYIKLLKEQKIISQAEVSSVDINTLFEKYYFGDQTAIDLRKLAGLQYMNDGLYKFDDKRFMEALQQFEKAYLLYPSERMGFLLASAGTQAFLDLKDKNATHATLLAKLSNYERFGVTREMIIGEFQRTMHYLLSEQGKFSEMETYFRTLTENIKNAELKNEIEFQFYYENARIQYNQARVKESLRFSEQALKSKPSHIDGNSLFINCLARSLENTSSKEAIAILEAKLKDFPSLTSNNLFNQMLASSYLQTFEILYRMEDLVEGEKYRTTFENFYTGHKDLTINPQQVAGAYSAAAIYFFRRNQVTRAKNLIAKGLEISPDNYDLKQRQRILE